MAEVAVEGLTVRYGAAVILSGITLAFPDKGFFGLLGPSGSGKTTLLRAIAGFVTPAAGRVLFDGQPVERVPVERRDIGMVFQNYALFPNMTVAENVGFGLSVRGVSTPEATRRVAEALDLVQLGPLAARKPADLSGGQRQRVAMARAIAPRPRVLLLDEPLSALDKALRVDMQIELKRIQREVGITTIFVTHDQEEALTLSDRIGILRDGRLIRHGPPLEVYENPGDRFTAGFLGEANLLTDQDRAEAGVPPGTGLCAVRPESLAVTLADPGSGHRLRARLQARVYAGAVVTLVLDREGARWKALGQPQDFEGLAEGAEVWLSWRPDKVMRLAD
jgi:ABC-type Fe3+/spermidine/putrescine transport system ATPase subunit